MVATALRDWLPLVIHDIEPFLSSDIDAGARWQSELAAELEQTDFGILCVTAENQQSPWLNFEAGALAKKVGDSRVIPLAIDLRPAEIQNPLAQFQAQPLMQSGMTKIMLTINSVLPKPLLAGHVEKVMSKWWPDLESETQKIEQHLSLDVFEEIKPADRDLLEEVVVIVRGIAKHLGSGRVDYSPYLSADMARRVVSALSGEVDHPHTVKEIDSRVSSLEERFARHLKRARAGLGTPPAQPPAQDRSSDD